MKDADGHQLVWFASKSIEVSPGDTMEFSSGSVKSHGSYRGKDQTIMTRMRISNIIEAPKSDQGEEE